MLSPFIIDQIRKLEEEKRQQRQSQHELELPRLIPCAQQEESDDERGVFAIDLL